MTEGMGTYVFMDTGGLRLLLDDMKYHDTEQVSYLAEFLLSDNAKYITGELIVMSGGMTY